MDLEFQQKPLTYLQKVVSKPQTQEQTQEVRLPEGMPEIGNVVTCWGQVILRGKEWRGDRIGVNGGIMVWIMYLPEDENTPQSVSTWIPFQMKWEIPQTRHDGTIMAKPFLRSVDARSLSARKLMVRATFGVDLEALVQEEKSVATAEDLPADIHLLKKTYPLCLPAEAGEKPFQMEECFALPGNLPKPRQIIRNCLMPMITEWKLMADKMVFRGHIHYDMLYRCENGQLHTWQQQIQFSQFGELDQEYDDSCGVKLCCVVTDLEADLQEDGQICLKTGISAQYVICKEHMVTVVEDAYSNLRQITPHIESLLVPSVLDRRSMPVTVEQTVEADAGQVVDLCLYTDEPQQTREGDNLELHIPGSFSLLYLDPEGNYQSTHAYWEENLPFVVSEDGNVTVSVNAAGLPVAGMSSNGVSMQADLSVDTETTQGQGIPMVTGLAYGEEYKENPNRPSLILRRAGADSLWKIAKETGSSVDMIRNANNLEGEPDAKQMLLIPIP